MFLGSPGGICLLWQTSPVYGVDPWKLLPSPQPQSDPLETSRRRRQKSSRTRMSTEERGMVRLPRPERRSIQNPRLMRPLRRRECLRLCQIREEERGSLQRVLQLPRFVKTPDHLKSWNFENLYRQIENYEIDARLCSINVLFHFKMTDSFSLCSLATSQPTLEEDLHSAMCLTLRSLLGRDTNCSLRVQHSYWTRLLTRLTPRRCRGQLR